MDSNELLTRRVAKILPDKAGLGRLIGTKKIRLYQGIDPTAARLHLGHTVGLRKLAEFVQRGDEVMLLFGTGTVLVGDPSLRDSGRKLITQEEIDANIKSWQRQAAPIIDFSRVKLVQNGDWLLKLTLKDIIRLGAQISALQLFKRESFTRRINRGDTVWYHETMYPLLQGYDSVVLDVDLEIGGTDQEFNMLMGRELQRKLNKREKFVMTVPMILGTDGNPMSKTAGNCVWLTDSAADMYGKLMAITDKQIKPYFTLLTDMPLAQIARLKADPLTNKKRLALAITAQFHGQRQALRAQEHFEMTIQRRGAPGDLAVLSLANFPKNISGGQLLVRAKLAVSHGAAKRLIRQGAVSLDGVKMNEQTPLVPGILKVGKLKWLKLVS